MHVLKRIEMKTIRSEYIVPVDVDSTLVLPNESKYSGREVKVYDAVTKSYITMKAHEPNIRLLTEERYRGAVILVWSRGGYEWAENVVKALELEGFVDFVMSKPLTYIDDLDVQNWLSHRVWLDPNMNYKK